MPQNPKNNVNKPTTALVAPLDWGLGHTTRIIPVVKLLLSWHLDIIIACNSEQKALLAAEFPAIRYFDLPGYQVVYGKSATQTLGKIIFQLPGVLFSIIREHLWLRRFIKKHDVQLVISDNRYGFYSNKTKNYLITHQLRLLTGLGNRVDYFFQWFGYKLLNRFDVCLIPDFSEEENLAGRLSHPETLPQTPVKYIGSLSRFTACFNESKAFDLMVLISGPEPQRTIFEMKIMAELIRCSYKAIVVRGLPGSTEVLNSSPEVMVLNHASSNELNKLMCFSDVIIARSGYTTIMDVLKLHKKSILIPTPGQTEQEYLASYLHSQQLVFTVSQNDFSLPGALIDCNNFAFKKVNFPMEQYKIVLAEVFSQ